MSVNICSIYLAYIYLLPRRRSAQLEGRPLCINLARLYCLKRVRDAACAAHIETGSGAKGTGHGKSGQRNPRIAAS